MIATKRRRLARAGWPAEHDPDLLWLKPHLARLRAKLDEAGWQGVLGVRAPVSTAQRYIVLLRPPSLAQRVRVSGGRMELLERPGLRTRLSTGDALGEENDTY